MSPGGGACYEDLGDSSDVMPQDSDVVECSSQKYKDLIYTESLTDGKTYKESCTIEVYSMYTQVLSLDLCLVIVANHVHYIQSSLNFGCAFNCLLTNANN